MPDRRALLIGSLPYRDEEACMTRALDVLGSHLISLPDGEIGEKSERFPEGNRIAWVMYAVEKLTEDAEHWRVVKEPVRGADGMATDYDGIQKLAPRLPPAQMAEAVTFGYDDWFRKSYPVFQRLRSERGVSLPFQLGVPTGFALGFAFASRVQWLRYTGALNTVIAREVDAARAEAGDEDLIVQIEAPPEVFVAHTVPTPLLGLSLRPILDLLGKLKPGARIGIHLCLGDFHNKALVHPRSPARLVAMANRLVARWPADHRLEYVHFPFAEGEIPPPDDPSWYRGLDRVALPEGTRFVAGLAHEGLELAQARAIVASIEAARGAPVDIAASCGLGRRTPAEADLILERMRALVEG